MILRLIPFLVLLVSAFPCYATELRVRNASDTDFQKVVLNAKVYGDIKRGMTTSYQTHQVIYHACEIELIAGLKPLGIVPTDNIGERPLGEGKFTCVLTLKDGRINTRVEKDNP